MISSKNAMIEINKVLNSVFETKSLSSVQHMQHTIESCLRCISLADEVIKNDSSYEIGMYYIAILEDISKKIRNDCNLPLLANMILQKCLMVGETLKRINK